MEFPLTGLVEVNRSDASVGHGSLYGRRPVVAGLYVGVLGVAAVVGTVGNLVVVAMVTVARCRGRRRRTKTGNEIGRVFIANLALSDLIVTALINPLAIAGLSVT